MAVRSSDIARSARLVMVVLDDATASPMLVRGSTTADALRAQILAVLAISPTLTPEHATRVIARVATDVRNANAPRGSIVDVCRGAVAQAARRVARTISPLMIIVGATFGAAAACRLAADLRTPVLVARTLPRGRGVIAASDMTRLDLPVLSSARKLARALDHPVTFLHNASPLTAPNADLVRLEREVVAAKSARLRGFAGSDETIETIVTRERDDAEAVVKVARARDADVVVVGFRVRSNLSRLHSGVAERVAEHCERSVLIAPIG